MFERGEQMDKKKGVSETEPEWLRRLRRSVFAVVFFAAGALVGQITKVADDVGNLYDRYFKQPDALILADQSAKSRFSDELAQRAWRRFFWANIFRGRVEKVAPLADIDASWKSYIDADADWNAKSNDRNRRAKTLLRRKAKCRTRRTHSKLVFGT
jgi:hypothetical protein